jgi:pilus assembly protein CpaB
MNNRALTLSLVMAILAVFFVQSYVSTVEEQARKNFGTEIVVVTASRDIREMETMNQTMVQMKLIPKKFLEPAAIAFEKKSESDKDAEKRMNEFFSNGTVVALVPLKKGEQITYNKLTEPSMRTGLSPQIAPGRRALAIPVNETTGVSKLVKPGDRVDLIAVMQLGQSKEGRIAKTMFQDIVVLATGRAVTNNVSRTVEQDPFTGKERIRSLTEDSSFASVTVEVEPAQAQMLALVVSNPDNQIILSLRNNDDTDRTNLLSTGFEDLVGADARRIPAGAGPQRR